MDFRLKIVSFLLSLAIIGLVLKSLKKAWLHPSFAAVWLGIAAVFLLLPFISTGLAGLASNVFGIVGGDHLIYISLLGFLLVYAFYLTRKICRLTDQVGRIISSLADRKSVV